MPPAKDRSVSPDVPQRRAMSGASAGWMRVGFVQKPSRTLEAEVDALRRDAIPAEG